MSTSQIFLFGLLAVFVVGGIALKRKPDRAVLAKRGTPVEWLYHQRNN